MTKIQMVCQNQKLDWEPSPTKTQVQEDLAKDGENLPNSVTEDIRGFSLQPWYSDKQLSRIKQLRMKKFVTKKQNGVRTLRKSKDRYLLLKHEYNQEGY
jgi:hypothetical protein